MICQPKVTLPGGVWGLWGLPRRISSPAQLRAAALAGSATQSRAGSINATGVENTRPKNRKAAQARAVQSHRATAVLSITISVSVTPSAGAVAKCPDCVKVCRANVQSTADHAGSAPAKLQVYVHRN